MIQKKYLCKDLHEADEAIGKISEELDKTPHRAALVNIYETGFSKDEMRSFVERLKNSGHSELLTAGISLLVVAEIMQEGRGILLNLILTEEADIDVVTIPCVPGEESKAAEEFRTKLDETENVKAVELFVTNMALNTTQFMREGMRGHEDAVLFGTSTIRNLPTKLSAVDDNTIELEQVETHQIPEVFAGGSDILPDGFVAVVFSGEKLKVQAEYALGWNPIGKKLNLEFGDDPEKGETVITSINGAPAVDIYKEYLGVYPDSYLISNVCEFPFIVERDGINICSIPIDCDKEGKLYFMMTINRGEKLRFTFASHDEVLRASLKSLQNMTEFGPEALFLTLCGNRINFLKEDAHIEWDGFKSVCPDYALMHGACELYYHEGRGGILNSAHLAVGMRESEEPAKAEAVDVPSYSDIRHGRVLSLSDRMSVFLSRITTELIDMAKEASDANNAKSAFLSHMSHEIRTPINAILGMNEMILQDSREEEITEYASSIRSAGSNLLNIVNDILDLSKIEAGKMSIIPVEYELYSVINDLYNVVRLRAMDKGLSVKLDIDPEIPSVLFGDETRIKQVVTNLLTNAVKYTEKGTVTLSIKRIAAVEDSVMLRVQVKDTGIGIRPEDMEKLFDEYERFDELRNRTIEGTGLGLAITTDLLRLMGSRLKVESTYGEGSVFGFDIEQDVRNKEPIGDLSEKFNKKTVRKYRVRFTAEDARILVVDDSAVNLSVVVNLLKKTKIGVDTAQSGEDALRLIGENEYDLIFLDHLMPVMDGNETLKRMNALENNLSKNSPVICLTANASSTARDEYIKAGYRDYLPKPVSLKDLEDMLFSYIPPEKIRTLPIEN
ncbi:MAG: response regulator [Lachnospiraceae bacterium]|nr:response regulator [Lachnospiraceae bacterium]